MGKIVKHCAACEESFAEKFGFCPNCGGVLKAFEMNPIQEEARAAAADKMMEAAKVSESPIVSATENNNFITPAIPSTKIYDIGFVFVSVRFDFLCTDGKILRTATGKIA